MQILIDSSAVALGLSVINATSLIVIAIWYFKNNYTIVTKYNQVIEAESDNCGGGSGFFRECIYEEDEA